MKKIVNKCVLCVSRGHFCQSLIGEMLDKAIQMHY